MEPTNTNSPESTSAVVENALLSDRPVTFEKFQNYKTGTIHISCEEMDVGHLLCGTTNITIEYLDDVDEHEVDSMSKFKDMCKRCYKSKIELVG